MEAIPLNIVVWLLFVHWVADFVMQTDWMAQNKSKNVDALLLHCAVYGLTVGVMTSSVPLGLFTSVAHVPVDAITSRINAKLWAEKKVHWFFVSVGFDQWIHFVVLFVLAGLVAK